MADALNQMTKVFKENKGHLNKMRSYKLEIKKLKKENASLFVRLLNEEQLRKSTYKIKEAVDEMVNDYENGDKSLN